MKSWPTFRSKIIRMQMVNGKYKFRNAPFFPQKFMPVDGNKVVVSVDCSSKVSLKVDNSQCSSHCFSTSTAAQFISQSLHDGKFKPVAPIKSVKGMIALIIFSKRYPVSK